MPRPHKIYNFYGFQRTFSHALRLPLLIPNLQILHLCKNSSHPSNAAEVLKEHKKWDHQANCRAIGDKQQKHKNLSWWRLISTVFNVSVTRVFSIQHFDNWIFLYTYNSNFVSPTTKVCPISVSSTTKVPSIIKKNTHPPQMFFYCTCAVAAGIKMEWHLFVGDTITRCNFIVGGKNFNLIVRALKLTAFFVYRISK